MPVTPDDFDSQPPATHEPPAPTGVPFYQPPARVPRAAPATVGTPGWVKLVIILVILFILFSLASNGVQRQEAPATDTAFDTTVTATSMHLQRGVRRYTPSPFRLHTWPSGPGAGEGVDMVFTGVIVRDHETLVTLHISSDHNDVLLYDQLHLIVDGTTTLDSTSGLEGGRQSSLNNFTDIRRIDIFRGEHVVLVARFPPLSDDAKNLKFVSPRLGDWQNEWSWENIELRDIAVFPEN